MKANDKRRQAIIRFILLCVEHLGTPPSVREIAAAAGVTIRPAWRYLHCLAKAGYLEIKEKIARGLKVTEAGRQYAGV